MARAIRETRYGGNGQEDAARASAPETAGAGKRTTTPPGRQWGPVALPSTLREGRAAWVAWLTVYVAGVVAAVALAVAAHQLRPLPGDVGLALALQSIGGSVAYNVLYFVSYIGYPTLSGVIFAVVFVVLLVTRLRVAAFFLLVSLLAEAMTSAIKVLVARPRPTSGLIRVAQHLGSFSFPSGHTVHYTVFYGFLAFVLARRISATWWRRAVVWPCLVLIALVGPSRVYLGEHWPSDVIGGYLIGALFLAPLILGYWWVERSVRLTGQVLPWRRPTTPATPQA